MIQNDRADLVSGLLIASAGVAVTVYAASNYPLGTLRRMGPGMFPTGLGVTLALLGLVLAFNSWRSLCAVSGGARMPVRFELRTAFLCVAGVVAFALLLRPLGLVPAVLAVVGISALSDRRNTLLAIAALVLFLSVLAVLIFKLGLGMTFPLFAWNWS